MSAPDLKTITERMESDVNHYIPGAELRPRFSVLGVLNKVYSAAIYALYQFAENLIKNVLPATCTDDWLTAWGYVLRTPRKEGESLADWRNRLIIAFANRAKIGDADDYREWVIASHPEIKNAWVYGNTPELGDITIVVLTGADNPIPTAAILAEAQLKLDRLRNVAGYVNLIAPQVTAVDVRLANIPSDQRAAVEAVLKAHIDSLQSGQHTLYIADLHEAIRTIYRGNYSLLAPLSDITVGELVLIRLGSLAWA